MKKTGHIQQKSLLAQTTRRFYMREYIGWRIYTSKTEDKSTSCDSKYRRHSQVEQPYKWKIIASIEQTGEYCVRHKGSAGMIYTYNRSQ